MFCCEYERGRNNRQPNDFCGNFDCSKTKTKQLHFESLPLFFPVHIKRFFRDDQNEIKKNNNKLTFGPTLSLKVGNVTKEMELIAIICHDGKNLQAGHYFTWVKLAKNWAKVSDENPIEECLFPPPCDSAVVLLYRDSTLIVPYPRVASFENQISTPIVQIPTSNPPPREEIEDNFDLNFGPGSLDEEFEYCPNNYPTQISREDVMRRLKPFLLQGCSDSSELSAIGRDELRENLDGLVNVVFEMFNELSLFGRESQVNAMPTTQSGSTTQSAQLPRPDFTFSKLLEDSELKIVAEGHEIVPPGYIQWRNNMFCTSQYNPFKYSDSVESSDMKAMSFIKNMFGVLKLMKEEEESCMVIVSKTDYPRLKFFGIEGSTTTTKKEVLFLSPGLVLIVAVEFAKKTHHCYFFETDFGRFILNSVLTGCPILMEEYVFNKETYTSPFLLSRTNKSPKKVGESLIKSSASLNLHLRELKKNTKHKKPEVFYTGANFLSFLSKHLKTEEEKLAFLNIISYRNEWKSAFKKLKEMKDEGCDRMNDLYIAVLLKTKYNMTDDLYNAILKFRPQCGFPALCSLKAVYRNIFKFVAIQLFRMEYIREEGLIKGFKCDPKLTILIGLIFFIIRNPEADINKLMELLFRWSIDARRMEKRKEETVTIVQFLGNGSNQSPSEVIPLSLYFGSEKGSTKVMESLQKELGTLQSVTYHIAQLPPSQTATPANRPSRNPIQTEQVQAEKTKPIKQVYCSDLKASRGMTGCSICPQCDCVRKCNSKDCKETEKEECKCHLSLHDIFSYNHQVLRPDLTKGVVKFSRHLLIPDILHLILRILEHLILLSICSCMQGGMLLKEVNDWMDTNKIPLGIGFANKNHREEDGVTSFTDLTVASGSQLSRIQFLEKIGLFLEQNKKHLVKVLDENFESSCVELVATQLTIIAESWVKHRSPVFYWIRLVPSSLNFQQFLLKLRDRILNRYAKEDGSIQNWIDIVVETKELVFILIDLAANGVFAVRKEEEGSEMREILTQIKKEKWFGVFMSLGINNFENWTPEKTDMLIKKGMEEDELELIWNHLKENKKAFKKQPRMEKEVNGLWSQFGAFQLMEDEQVDAYALIYILYVTQYCFLNGGILKGDSEHVIGHVPSFLREFKMIGPISISGFERRHSTEKNANEKSTNKRSNYKTKAFEDLIGPTLDSPITASETVFCKSLVISCLEVMYNSTLLPRKIEEVDDQIRLFGNTVSLPKTQQNLDFFHKFADSIFNFLGRNPIPTTIEVPKQSDPEKTTKKCVVLIDPSQKMDFSKLGIEFGHGATPNDGSQMPREPPEGVETTQKRYRDNKIFRIFLEEMNDDKDVRKISVTRLFDELCLIDHWSGDLIEDSVEDPVPVAQKSTPEKPKCLGTTINKTPCQASPLKGKQFCRFHIPK